MTTVTTELTLDSSQTPEDTTGINRSAFEQQVAKISPPTLRKIDESKPQKFVAAASMPMPIPFKKINIEDFVIVWLDANIGQNDNTRKTIEQLSRIVNEVRTFTVRVECIEFVLQIKNEQVFFIVSGSLGQETVPYVNQFRQIEGIYIFCVNVEKHLQWAKNYRKVKGVFSEIEVLCEQIRRRMQRVMHDLVGFHVVGKSSTIKQEASFMYAQLLQEILLEMDPNQCNLQEMIEFCRFQYAGNSQKLREISDFEQTFVPDLSVRWYTKQSFLYEMLNKALRILEIDTMYAFRFYIQHLHNQLVKLYKQSFVDTSICLYRGQQMHNDEFEKLKDLDCLLSIPSFLSTTLDIGIARRFVSRASRDDDKVAVIMIITIKQPFMGNVPFANIKELSEYETEEEWLFSMGSVFRVRQIQEHNDGIWYIYLTPTDNADPQLNSLKIHMREDIIGTDPLIKLGIVLRAMGQYDKAEQFYKKAFTTVNYWKDRARIHNDLGLIYWNAEKLDDALEQFQRSLSIKGENVPHNSILLASLYNSIGIIYSAKKHFNYSVKYYSLALDAENQASNPNKEGIASILSNIGNDLCAQGKYLDGLSRYQQALEIRLNVLPSIHTSIAKSYNNIAECYYRTGRIVEAINYAQKALHIDWRSLPKDHPQTKLHQNNFDMYQQAMKS